VLASPPVVDPELGEDAVAVLAHLNDPGVQELLEKPNHAVLSTISKDGSVNSAVVWLNVEDRAVAINSARGRACTVAMKYINPERYPWRQPDEERVKFRITPERVRHARAYVVTAGGGSRSQARSQRAPRKRRTA
jgi:hypothetical protein